MAPVGGNSRLDDDDDDSSLLHLFDDYEDYEREMMKYEAYRDMMKFAEESFAVGFLTEPIFPTEIPSGVKNVVQSTGAKNVVQSTGAKNVVQSTGAKNVVQSTGVKNGELEGMHGTSSMARGNTSDGVKSRLDDDDDDDSSLLHLFDDYEDYEREMMKYETYRDMMKFADELLADNTYLTEIASGDKNGELEGMHGTSSMAWGNTNDGGSVAAGNGVAATWMNLEHAPDVRAIRDGFFDSFFPTRDGLFPMSPCGFFPVCPVRFTSSDGNDDPPEPYAEHLGDAKGMKRPMTLSSEQKAKKTKLY